MNNKMTTGEACDILRGICVSCDELIEESESQASIESLKRHILALEFAIDKMKGREKDA